MEERQRRMNENLCLYCGDSGHIIASCPKRGGSRGGVSSNRQTIGVTSIPGKLHPYLHIEILVGEDLLTSVDAFVDSGADSSLVDMRLVQSLGIPYQDLDTPISFENIEGKPLSGGIIKHYAMLKLKSKDVVFTHQFHLLPSSIHPIVLGIDWLHKYDPLINRTSMEI